MEKFRGIGISPDLHPKERDEIKQCKASPRGARNRLDGKLPVPGGRARSEEESAENKKTITVLPSSSLKSLKCLYTNANSVVGKIDELKFTINKGNYDVIAITESWANSEIADSELHIDGYVLYRKDRPAPTKGGGVLLYLRDTLNSEPLMQLTNFGFSDSVWAQIRLDICIGCMLQKYVQ